MQPTVFIVDDDPDVLTALARRLRADGLLVETFTSPASFLDRLPYDGVACLLLDLQMPELSGLDLQNVMADRGITMPIVFLSGKGDVPSTARAMREGAVDFLVKPVRRGAAPRCRDAGAGQGGAGPPARPANSVRPTGGWPVSRSESAKYAISSRSGLLNKQIAFQLGTARRRSRCTAAG